MVGVWETERGDARQAGEIGVEWKVVGRYAAPTNGAYVACRSGEHQVPLELQNLKARESAKESQLCIIS